MESSVTRTIDCLGTKGSVIQGQKIPRSWDTECQAIEPIKSCAPRIVFSSLGNNPRLSLKLFTKNNSEEDLLSINTAPSYWISAKEFSERFAVPISVIGARNFSHLIERAKETHLPETLDTLSTLLKGHPAERVRKEGIAEPIFLPPVFKTHFLGRDLYELTQHVVTELKNSDTKKTRLQWKNHHFLVNAETANRIAITLWSGSSFVDSDSRFYIENGRTSIIQSAFNFSHWTPVALKILRNNQIRETAKTTDPLTTFREKIRAKHEKKLLQSGEALLAYLHDPKPLEGVVPKPLQLHKVNGARIAEMTQYPTDLYYFTGLGTPPTLNSLQANLCTREQIVRMSLRIATALAKIHEKKVICFDLKHSNILVATDKQGQPYADIADLDEAMKEDEIHLDGSDSLLTLYPVGYTLTGGYCCSEDLEYLQDTYAEANQKFSKKEYEELRSKYINCHYSKDVLALGCVLWQLLGFGLWSCSEIDQRIDWQNSFGRSSISSGLAGGRNDHFKAWSEEKYGAELVSFLRGKVLIRDWTQRASARELVQTLEQALLYLKNHGKLGNPWVEWQHSSTH